MIEQNYKSFWEQFSDWNELREQVRQRLESNGNFPKWCNAVRELPSMAQYDFRASDTVTLEATSAITDIQKSDIRVNLMELHPWRKGPFEFFGVQVQTEWRSDFKWNRVLPHIAIDGHTVLDIGCGNGYFGWRMLEAGAQSVVGLDPMVLFCVQYFALNRYLQSDSHWVLPLRFEQVRPELTQERFDSVFSMGVLYHQRNPQQHIQDIKKCLKPEGQLVLETLIVEGKKSLDLEGRYAKMRNVWNVPCPGELTQWVRDSGFSDVEILDVNRTTFEEQNRTDWMTFESLPNYLDPDDPNKTIEGYPAPTRCLVRAVKK